MGESSTQYHEPYEELSDATRNMHRAIVSVMEELEAIDWYQQRAEACTDDDLAGILRHNMEEEMEHAVMGLEWIRKNLPGFDATARRYLFGGELNGGAQDASLGLGGLKEE